MTSPSPPAPTRRSQARSPDPIVVSTKLSPPRVRQHLVPRKRLTALLDQVVSSPSARLALLAAPAGFGKTTLIAQWLHEQPRPSCWVAFDPSDNDEVVFWMYLIEGLRDIHPGVGQQSLWELRTPRPAIRRRVVPLIVRELQEVAADSVVVLDDFHLITSPACIESLEQFLALRPARIRVVMATRAEPRLPLSLFRTRGQLVEIRAEDLRFTRQESAEMLGAPAVPGLRRSEVDLLHERTEGWPAGLYLATLSLRGPAGPVQAALSFTAANRYVLDYLGAEVMTDLDPAAREFLVQTSVLDRVTGGLADAVTGGGGGDVLLERLWRTNRLVLALDDDRRWYRYHHLLREFLQAELARRGPDAAAAAHLRASEWLAAAGMVPTAIGHALDGGDLHRAALVLDAHRVELLDAGLARTILGWLARLPDDVVVATPRLVLLATSALHLVDASPAAYERWEALVRAHPAVAAVAGPDAEGTPLNLLRVADVVDNVGQAVSAAQDAVAREVVDSPGWCYAQALLARALRYDATPGADQAAERAASSALQATDIAVAPFTRWAALSVLALCRLDAGDVVLAASLASRALTEVVNQRRYGSPDTSLVHVALGRCRAHEGDFETAHAELQFALSLRRSGPAGIGVVYNLIAIAEASALAGDRAGAAAVGDKARELMGTLSDPGRLGALLAAALRRRQPASDEAPLPQLTNAEARVLRLLGTSLSQRDIGRELYLSQNTVKSHTRSLYRKLGVARRSDAVVAARSRGWLS